MSALLQSSVALRPASFASVAKLSPSQASQRPLRAYNLRVKASTEEPQEPRSWVQKLAMPAAAVLGAALLFGATPDVAEAARSGGRVGGSSGFSQRRAAPAPRSA